MNNKIMVDRRPQRNAKEKIFLWFSKEMFWIMIVLIIGILSFTSGRASADPVHKTKPKMRASVYEEYVHAKPAITTTTKPYIVRETSTTNVRKPAQAQVSGSGVPVTSGAWVEQCKAWMIEAGYEEWEMPYALYIIDGESDCNPTVKNPGSSAYGIPQALNTKEHPEPGGKMAMMGEGWQTNPVLQLRWMKIYCTDPNGNHGSWQEAYNAKRYGGTY